MNKIIGMVLVSLLCLLAGCATVTPASPEAANLKLSATNKVVILSCYFKKTTIFSSSIPASKEEFPEFIQKETGAFVSGLGNGMSGAGFTDVAFKSLSAGHCDIAKNEINDGVTTAVLFTMVGQHFGLSEDAILADTFIKVPGKDLMVGVGRKAINGGFTKAEAKSAAEETVPVLVKRIRDAQKR